MPLFLQISTTKIDNSLQSYKLPKKLSGPNQIRSSAFKICQFPITFVTDTNISMNNNETSIKISINIK
jgi:hypothetical protein